MRTVFILLISLFATVAKAQDYSYPINMEKEGFVIPRVSGKTLDEILHSKHIIYYKLPRIYQQFSPASQLEVENTTLGHKFNVGTKPIFGIFTIDVYKDTNANDAFPWATTVGLDYAKKDGHVGIGKDYIAINFLYVTKPILIITNEKPYQWIFPERATIVGEIIYLKDGKKWLPLEVRARYKTETTWEPRRYAPVKNREHFVQLTKLNYSPGKKYIFHRNPEQREVVLLQGLIERVPETSPEMVRYLVGRTFTNVTNEQWSNECHVPASDVVFNIYPKDYSLGLIASVDSFSCAQCHKQTSISVRNLVPEEPKIIENFTKVGNIRGSDGIFSWYPFAKDCIRTSPADPSKSVKFRKYDVENNIIEFQKPDTEYVGYRLTPYVQESLKDYEHTIQGMFLHKKDEEDE